jgi:uncharacterized protein YjbK
MMAWQKSDKSEITFRFFFFNTVDFRITEKLITLRIRKIIRLIFFNWVNYVLLVCIRTSKMEYDISSAFEKK